MSRPDVTIVVSPRERFSAARMTLETLLAVTQPPFKLVYVDGGAPASIRRWLDWQSRTRGFRLIGGGRYLSPDRARNLGFQAVDTEYAVFLDNDVVVSPGWLDALLDCAEESGAWLVGPLYCVDRPLHTVVHMAGGPAHVEERDGVRRFVEQHFLMGKTVAEVRQQLARGPTEQLELHCLLARCSAMRALGPLDPRFESVPEGQIDLCMRARAMGGPVWLAPDAVVTYDRPPPMRPYDVPYYLTRWSEHRGRAGLEHFRRRWDLAEDDPYFQRQLRFMQWQRSHALGPLVRLLGRLDPWRRQRIVESVARGIALITEVATGLAINKEW
jgi:hypothetical protein